MWALALEVRVLEVQVLEVQVLELERMQKGKPVAGALGATVIRKNSMVCKQVCLAEVDVW